MHSLVNTWGLISGLLGEFSQVAYQYRNFETMNWSAFIFLMSLCSCLMAKVLHAKIFSDIVSGSRIKLPYSGRVFQTFKVALIK